MLFENTTVCCKLFAFGAIVEKQMMHYSDSETTENQMITGKSILVFHRWILEFPSSRDSFVWSGGAHLQ